jgi:hypothetical protein
MQSEKSEAKKSTCKKSLKDQYDLKVTRKELAQEESQRSLPLSNVEEKTEDIFNLKNPLSHEVVEERKATALWGNQLKRKTRI